MFQFATSFQRSRKFLHFQWLVFFFFFASHSIITATAISFFYSMSLIYFSLSHFLVSLSLFSITTQCSLNSSANSYSGQKYCSSFSNTQRWLVLLPFVRCYHFVFTSAQSLTILRKLSSLVCETKPVQPLAFLLAYTPLPFSILGETMSFYKRTMERTKELCINVSTVCLHINMYLI